MKSIKFSFTFFLILIILFSITVPCFADDSVYVWSSTSTPINNTSNSSNISNSSNTSNTSSNNANTSSVSNTNSSNQNVTNSSISTSANISTLNDTNISNNTLNTTNSLNENSNTLETNASTDENNSLNLESESAILIEQKTGQILYSHNIHEQLRPASVTKVMSILLIMEALANGKISLGDQVPCSENAASMGGSQIWLDTRETLTVDEMLKAICVNSANDCVVAMAEYIAGSEDAFVQMMNDKAKELRNERHYL